MSTEFTHAWLIDEPIPFEGTAEQRAANYGTHNFQSLDGEDFNCVACDCKPWHKAADYPCGTDVPRRVRCVDCTKGVKHEHTAEDTARLARYS